MRNYLPVAVLLVGILAADFFSHESVSRANYNDFHPVPSPDGRFVAFESDRDGHCEVYMLTVDSGQMRRITVTEDNGESRFPRWSPDGKLLVYQSRRSPKDNWQLFVIERKRWVVKKISEEEEHSDSEAVFSPDGKKLVFVCTRKDDPDGSSYLCIMNIDGSGYRRVSESPFEKHFPSWSPDGSRIAYSERSDAGNFEILSVTTERGIIKKITDNVAYDNIQPAWSADGSKVAFVSNRDGHNEVYIMNADGSRQTRMTRSSHFNSYRPVWSGDGVKIFFDSDRSGSLDLYSVSIDGSSLVRLTRKPESALAALIRDQGVSRGRSVFDAARSKEPDEVLFREMELTALGYTYLENNRTAEAAEIFRMNTLAYPSAEAYSGLAEVLKARDSSSAPTELEFFRAFRIQGFRKAVDLYEEAQKHHPGWVLFDDENMEKMAVHLMVQDNKKTAMEVLEFLIRVYPNRPSAYVHQAKLLLKQKKKQEAVESLKKAFALDPTDRKVANLLKSIVRK